MAALWDFNQPALSEQRFRDALPNAQGYDEMKYAGLYHLNAYTYADPTWFPDMSPEMRAMFKSVTRGALSRLIRSSPCCMRPSRMRGRACLREATPRSYRAAMLPARAQSPRGDER